jgi:hypothetical protein
MRHRARRSSWLLGAMDKRRLLLLCLVMLGAQSAAACVAPDPVATARWIYSNQRAFASQKQGEDLRKRADFLSPALYKLLRTEWKCEDAEQGPCKLWADPWINAQDGEEQAVTFEPASATASAATVRMRFQFVLNPPSAQTAEATLHFTLNPKSGCWLLDDLVGRAGHSLKKQLQTRTPLEMPRDVVATVSRPRYTGWLFDYCEGQESTDPDVTCISHGGEIYKAALSDVRTLDGKKIVSPLAIGFPGHALSRDYRVRVRLRLVKAADDLRDATGIEYVAFRWEKPETPDNSLERVHKRQDD